MLFSKLKKSGVEHVVAALGNPGKKYENTRHNAGFLCAAYLLKSVGADVRRARFHALTAELTLAGKRVLLLLPQTYMNRSGESVREALAFYKLPPEKLVVLSDDIHLPVGGLRIRKSGSAGGHNGLRSIREHLKSDAYARIRIGVGEPSGAGDEQIDWVLGDFSKADQQTLLSVFDDACKALELILNDDCDGAMNRFNRTSRAQGAERETK